MMNKSDRKELSALFDRIEAVKTKMNATGDASGPFAVVADLVESMTEELNDIKDQVEAMKDAEQEKFDNMTDGLQQSERGQALEGGIGELENAVSYIDEVVTELESIGTAIENVVDAMSNAMSAMDNAMGS